MLLLFPDYQAAPIVSFDAKLSIIDITETGKENDASLNELFGDQPIANESPWDRTLVPPKLNNEIKAVLSKHHSVLKRDKYQVKAQSQVTVCFNAFGSGMSDLLKIFLCRFAADLSDCNILLRVNNTTAISYINRFGSIQHPHLMSFRQIWSWCEERNILLFASYIASINNSIAHYSYVTWFTDPGSIAVDAFTLAWSDTRSFAFPSFILLLCVLRKIVNNKAKGVVEFLDSHRFPLFCRLL
ncbi:hypothetical protein ALC62_12700 [Cyphomyrmex costatus]|uniref:Uncharacterized protein n=1 Tax=Cyphomyrmex costatus TaxID=456900 RepID=A0A195C965_9HYME|nr:hypothetical protein ALC62_12700 [Cyphomyrmex costatus]